VWGGVDKTLFALGAASPTCALSDGFDSHANTIAGFLDAFKAQPAPIGVIYRIGGALTGLDLFGSETAFARALPKRIRGSALQALAGFDKNGSAQLQDHAFLRAVLEAPADRFPAVGLAEEVRIDIGEIGGGALQLKGALVHLFTFRRSNPDRSGTIRRTHAH
jgi:hypothetical protein